MEKSSPCSREILHPASLQPDALQSLTIERLRFPLAVLVVFVHCFSGPAYDLTTLHADPLSAESLYSFLRILCSKVVSQAAVPTFFLISGFLFFRHLETWNTQIYLGKLRKRVRTLLVPYVLWCVIAIVYNLIVSQMAVMIKGKAASATLTLLNEKGWLSAFWCSCENANPANLFGQTFPSINPLHIPMWYVRNLMVVMVCAPLVYWLMKKLKWGGILLLGAAYLLRVETGIPGVGTVSFFYFSLGCYFAVHGLNFVRAFRRIEWLSYAASLLLLPLAVWYSGVETPEGYCYFSCPYVLVSVIALVCLASRCVERRPQMRFPQLPHTTFFVYAAHTCGFTLVAETLLQAIFPQDALWSLTLSYLLTPLLCVTLCVVAYFFLLKYLPRLLAILTGGRA